MDNSLVASSVFVGAALLPYARRYCLSLDKFLVLLSARTQARLALITPKVLRNILPRNRAPLLGDLEISPVWLTKIFKQQKIISGNNSVKSVNLEIDKAQGVNDGIAGAIVRFSVEYTNPDPKLPTAFILKRTPTRLINNVILAGQTREALFYNTTIAKSIYSVPGAIYSGTSLFGGVIIIMEDLSRKENPGTGVNYILGNQIWGVPPEMQSDIKPEDAIVEMFKFAAELQSKSWNDPNLLELSWLKSARWYRGLDRGSWEIALDTTRRGWEKCKSKLIPSGTVNFSEKLINIVDKSLANTNWENFQRRVRDRSIPFTITHGDFHAANMLWVRKDSSFPLRVVDWSEVGVWEPMTDLGQTIISDVKPELWKGKDEQWLKIYWDTLIAKGVSPTEFPFEACKTQYERAGVERWLWMLCLLNHFDGIPPSAFQYFHDQILAFIEAHGDHPYYLVNAVAVWVA